MRRSTLLEAPTFHRRRIHKVRNHSKSVAKPLRMRAMDPSDFSSMKGKLTRRAQLLANRRAAQFYPKPDGLFGTIHHNFAPGQPNAR